MIIFEYDHDKEEYEESVHVYPDGEIDGNTSLADSLRDELSGDGLSHPDGSDVKDGLKLMMLLDHRYNNGYHMTAWETKDGDMLYEEWNQGEEDE